MMQTSTVEELFPALRTVTQEIIDNSNVKDIWNCIGANLLKDFLGEPTKEDVPAPHWGISDGFYYTDTHQFGIESRDYTTGERVDMMKITEPRQILLKIVRKAPIL